MRYTIKNDRGETVARCVYPEDAAAFVLFYGEGASIKVGRKVGHTNGAESEEIETIAARISVL